MNRRLPLKDFNSLRMYLFILARAGIDKRLEDFDYSDVDMANLFHTIMNTTSFEGVSVSVHLTKEVYH